MKLAGIKAIRTLMGGVCYKRHSAYAFPYRRLLTVTILLLSLSTSSFSQNFAVKTNLLYDAAATANLGFEAGLAPRWTIDVSGNLNAWPIDGHKWKHWLVQPEARYWFCDRFQGHFLGLHGIASAYNVGYIPNDFKFLGNDFSVLTDHRYQGYGYGAGLAYGYAWALSRHLNLEFEIGAGYVYTRYDRYECDGCGKQVASKVPYHYFGPTKAAISLVYIF